MTSDLGHSTSLYPELMESLFMSSSLAVILIDWNHSFLERSLLRLILSYLPRWRYRNIRQDVYTCLVIVALALVYNNSMKNFAINMENCRIAGASIVVLLSFWLQSKTNPENVSDKCIGTSKIKVSDKSVQGESLVTRDQEVSVSTCCEAGIPQSLLSLLPSSSEPQSEVNIEEEMGQKYVKVFWKKFDEEIVPEEKLVTAIKYLNTLKGGITAHRDSDELKLAVDRIDNISSRLDDSGFPQDYSYDELRHIMVDEKKYRPQEFWRVLEKYLETSSFMPSPEEFEEFRNKTKVELEEEVEEKKQEVEEARQEVEETRQEVEETHQALERSMRVVEETTQEVVESRQKYRSLKQRLRQRDQALQQHQQALQQKDRIIQLLLQERQRVREQEQNPEDELQRRLQELEEENRRLSAKSNRAVCKFCWVEEVEVVFSPCNHSVSCEGCVPSIPQNKCPTCSETIQGTVRMILS